MKKKTYERFVIRPEYKPTNLGIPLDTSSAHPVHVHTSWPKAVLRRAMLLSSTLHGAEAAREVLRHRFIQHFAPKPIIDIFERNAYKENDEPKQSKKSKEKPLWLSIGFHPVWHRAITAAVGELTRDPRHSVLWKEAFGREPPPLRISWKKDSTDKFIND